MPFHQRKYGLMNPHTLQCFAGIETSHGIVRVVNAQPPLCLCVVIKDMSLWYSTVI